MAISLGSSTPSDYKLGSSQVTQIYLGTNLVWPVSYPVPVSSSTSPSTISLFSGDILVQWFQKFRSTNTSSVYNATPTVFDLSSTTGPSDLRFTCQINSTTDTMDVYWRGSLAGSFPITNYKDQWNYFAVSQVGNSQIRAYQATGSLGTANLIGTASISGQSFGCYFTAGTTINNTSSALFPGLLTNIMMDNQVSWATARPGYNSSTTIFPTPAGSAGNSYRLDNYTYVIANQTVVALRAQSANYVTSNYSQLVSPTPTFGVFANTTYTYIKEAPPGWFTGSYPNAGQVPSAVNNGNSPVSSRGVGYGSMLVS